LEVGADAGEVFLTTGKKGDSEIAVGRMREDAGYSCALLRKCELMG
jgi:hypothetical protein